MTFYQVIAQLKLSILHSINSSPPAAKSQHRAQVRSLHRERNRKEITVMLITLLLVFIVLHTPSLLCNFLHGFHAASTSVRVTTIEMSLLCSSGNFLLMANSATNFFAYVIFNKPFRRELYYCWAGLVRCQWDQRQGHRASSSSVYRATEWRRPSSMGVGRRQAGNLVAVCGVSRREAAVVAELEGIAREAGDVDSQIHADYV